MLLLSATARSASSEEESTYSAEIVPASSSRRMEEAEVVAPAAAVNLLTVKFKMCKNVAKGRNVSLALCTYGGGSESGTELPKIDKKSKVWLLLNFLFERNQRSLTLKGL